MFTRQRERQSVMAGMLFTYLILLFFATGCSRNPASSAEEGAPFATPTQNQQPALPEESAIGTEFFSPADLKGIWCLVFPPFCMPEPYPEPQNAWGGPDFHPVAAEVPAMAALHNACLSSWRKSERSAEGLMRTFEEEAAALGLSHHLDEKTRKEAIQLFTSLQKGEVTHEMIPGPDTVRMLFLKRPLPGPFVNDEPMLGMLEDLEDGISVQEVEEWHSFAHSLRFADPKEYWAASLMAASVAWWHAFSDEVGEDCSWGVYADLAAIQISGNPEVVAISSLAGALVDFIQHFWPDEKN